MAFGSAFFMADRRVDELVTLGCKGGQVGPTFDFFFCNSVRLGELSGERALLKSR